MKHIPIRNVLVSALAATFMSACAGNDDEGAGTAPGSNPAPASNTPSTSSSSADGVTPTPVASLTLENGNTVEFYDLESGTMVTERGLAGGKSFLQEGYSSRNPIATWQALAHGRPVPDAIRSLQDRLGERSIPLLTEQPATAPILTGAPMDVATPGGSDDGLLAAPDGCNNGCCDHDWLVTNYQCQVHGWINWTWMNFGWSTASSGGQDVKHYKGLVCAAAGSSVWHWQIGPSNYTWTVPEANFFVSYWDANCPLGGIFGCYDYPAISNVNTEANQALHAQCGYYMW